MRSSNLLWPLLWSVLTAGLVISVSLNAVLYVQYRAATLEDTSSLVPLAPPEGEGVGGAETSIERLDVEGEFVFPIHPDDYIMITSPHGYRVSPLLGIEMKHEGMDIIGPRYAQILAASSGRVVTHWPPPGTPYPGGGTFRGHPIYGGMVIIEHANGIQTLYAHLSRTNVSLHQEVSAGDIIGRMGNTGQVAGRNGGHHLHFEFLIDGTSVNPLLYVPDPEDSVPRVASE